MTDSKIEFIVDKIRKRMIALRDRKFFGNLNVEMNYKSGGFSSVYIGDRELINHE